MRFSPSIARFPWLSAEGLMKLFLDDSRAKNPTPPPSPPKMGLALSHGGARGLAHIGVIQVLEQEKIPIDVIAGSSMGAYIGALWASGIDGLGLEKLASEIKDRRTLIRLLDPVIPPMSGFIRGFKLRLHLARTLGDVTIDQLKKKMLIVATNLDALSGEILRDMPVAAAVHASCAIPGFCAPVKLNDNYYIDGGAAEPLPVKLLKSTANVDRVIAVNVTPTTDDLRDSGMAEFAPPSPKAMGWRSLFGRIGRHVNLFAYGNVLDTFKRCLSIAQMQLTADNARAADILIHPYLSVSKWYDFENFDRYIAAGREAATAALPQIRALLKSHPSINPHETVPLVSSVGCRST